MKDKKKLQLVGGAGPMCSGEGIGVVVRRVSERSEREEERIGQKTQE